MRSLQSRSHGADRTRCGRLGGAVKLACAVACFAGLGARAEDAEAIARAQRDAANPLRMIIEAGKLKPRQKAAEPEPVAKAPPEKVAVRAPAARPQASPAPPARAAAPASVAPVSLAAAAASAPVRAALLPMPAEATPDAAPASAAPEAQSLPAAPAAQAALPVAAPPEASVPYDPDNYFGAPPPSKAGLGATSAAPRSARAATAASSLAAAAAPPAVLQLAHYVEPVLPDRARRKLDDDGKVVLGFTVNPDGSVSDVAVRSASDKALEEIAVDAVRQWRYQPIAAAQAHGVQLVFKLRE